MKKRINLDQVFKTFEGEDIIETPEVKDAKGVVTKEVTKFTLKKMLLSYVRASQGMETKPEEQTLMYEIGIKIGGAEGLIDLKQSEYDLIKKLVDNGKVKDRDGQMVDFWDLEKAQQLKLIIDGAQNAPEADTTKLNTEDLAPGAEEVAKNAEEEVAKL